jgi:hypothetical protein
LVTLRSPGSGLVKVAMEEVHRRCWGFATQRVIELRGRNVRHRTQNLRLRSKCCTGRCSVLLTARRWYHVSCGSVDHAQRKMMLIQALSEFLDQVRASLHRSGSLLWSMRALRPSLDLYPVLSTSHRCGSLIAVRGDRARAICRVHVLVWGVVVEWKTMSRVGALRLKGIGTGFEEVAELGWSDLQRATRGRIHSALSEVGDSAAEQSLSRTAVR